MTRPEGWEQRLQAEVERARARPYAIGQHDCALFAIACVRAVTGVDYGQGIRGAYRSERGSRRLIVKRGGDGGLAGAVTRTLGMAPVSIRRARRGDPVLYRDAAGEDHLGVCLGGQAAVLGTQGLIFIGMAACRCAWNVG